MITTSEVVDFVRDTTPPPTALDRALVELGRFRRAARRGADTPLVATLKQVAVRPGSLLWSAWIDGTAAAAVDGRPAWVAVCAAANALAVDDGGAIEAVAIGYEVADRVRADLGVAHTEAGWSVQCTAGAIGAAAAAGRALGLDVGHVHHLIGLCATQAAGLAAAADTDTGPLQIGKAASNAVEAALLSRNGFTSAAQPLEGRRGLFALMSVPPAAAERNGTAADARLGAAWSSPG
ncbi:MmgE/PrpD family protein [Pseudonocardia xinjiangensis]|uniref:MmgE/PrpD family protein n=1 Tax=Pseudonocardia xinjiangensis TaxID=75289 RepID=A0ABX1R6I5_9PSEU|nr:MmgE/PrpD family protein [Pseudonocardia xinjiangensis]NMH76007.1 MmgE/PrpD family protein [Pseudonocardia xinjiangensis]